MVSDTKKQNIERSKSMKTERPQRSEKKTNSSSQRGKKSRETERYPHSSKEKTTRKRFEDKEEFANAYSSFPRRKKEDKPLKERLKSGNGDDKRKNRREFFTKQTETKSRSYRERGVEDNERRPARPRRDDDGRDTSPRKRYGEDNERKPARPRRDDDGRDASPRKHYGEDSERRPARPRRDDDGRDASPRRRYGEDNERRPARQRRDDDRRDTSPRKRYGEDNERKPARPRRDDDSRDASPRRRYEEKSEKPKTPRRRTGMELEIVREIVHKRRAEGRRSERRPKVLSLLWNEDRGLIRLNKYIANSGICSRREADDLIVAGAVSVNGQIVTELGAKVMPTDEVRYEDKILQREKPIYILLNKPKDYITTTEDERGRDNVMVLIEGACKQRVYPVGRLDRNTTGLLLFTNDGELTKKMTHPRFGIKKIYQVDLNKDLEQEDFEKLKKGIVLEDGLMQPDELEYVDGKRILGITLHSGKNRIIRRLFEHLGYEIEKLDRVYYAGLTKKNLPRGEWRILRQEEVNMLKMSI